MKTKILIPMGLCFFLAFFLGAYFGLPLRLYLSSFIGGALTKSLEEDELVIEPKIKVPELEPFQSILGKVVFVTKGIYGGDLWNVCILKGKIRNVTNKPYKDIYVLWTAYGPDLKLFPVIRDRYSKPIPSLFLDKIDYLDSKSEADFNISIDIDRMMVVLTGSRESYKSAEKIREAVTSGREEAGIFIRKEK